ncbi:MAG: FliM/FliN family flagellar motor C-terminal domain-containing protein [Tepidisphaeraceae bacterium]|jgi:flagellar motor switch protein FliN/FliY
MPVLHAQPPPASANPLETELGRILHLEVPIIVKLAERKLSVNEVMRLGVGAIIEFSKASDQPLELMINNKVIGVGETVKVGENFGLRITQIGDIKQIVSAMSGGR